MILAVIPARGGSKGIPRKNVRLMNGKPLICYAIQNALDSRYIDDVVVSSDDEEILSIASQCGAVAMDRESALAQDAVTLDPVIYDAVLRMEQRTGNSYDVAVTLQATSPLLSVETLDGALESFLASDYDTYISAVNRPHLSWRTEDGICVPNYEKRLNRQQLPADYLETGAFLITRRACVTAASRIGERVSVYEMPEKEATDIDDISDWIVCEQEMKKKKILFRADGYRELGMGHIYHCLTLAYHLTGHEILFVTMRRHEEGLRKLHESFMPLEVIEKEEDLFDILAQWKPDVVVNDCLDTTETYIRRLKQYVPRVVTIEDVGSGARWADAVVNALYEDRSQGNSYYWGENYVCLKDEFLMREPAVCREELREVTVIFGGADPGNFTARIYRLAKKLGTEYPNLHFTFLLGAAYDAKGNGIVSSDPDRITVCRDVKRVSDVFAKADFAFTSQGRTVYELAAMGIPAIVLAQNERETRHTFAQMGNGFINLGLGSRVDDETIESTFRWVLHTPQIRREMRNLMLQHDLRKGTERVIRLILQENDT
ncbi:MAG: cytidyltransferase [Lachnospiraceae bacterium]|nr:cytidyltransferase [Lachnospiraceae bacterium]